MSLHHKLKVDGVDFLALGYVNLPDVLVREVAEGDILTTMSFPVSIPGGGGVTIKGTQEVLFYEYETTTNLITYWFFGGHVAQDVTEPYGSNQTWVVQGVGGDVQLDWLDADSFGDAGWAISVATNTFANQVVDVTAQFQTQGGSPAKILDTSALPNWEPGTLLPAFTLPSCTMRDAYKAIAANFKAAFPLTAPRFSIIPPDSTSEGPWQVLWYDAAASPAAVKTIHVENPDLATTFPAVATKQRTKDYTQLRTAQNGLGAAIGGVAQLRARAVDSVAVATYPNPYSGRQQIGGSPVVNSQWITQAQVDAGVLTALSGKKAPRHSWQVGTWEKVRAGQYVKIASDTLEAVTNETFPVAEVEITFKTLRAFFLCTLGNRLRRYGDPDDTNLAAEDQPDVTGPPPPTSFALVDTPGGTYHGQTHDVSATFGWTAPADPTVARYAIRVTYAGHIHQGEWLDKAAVQGTFPAIPPATACTATIFAEDWGHNRSIDSNVVSFTTAAVDAPGPPTSLTYTSRYRGEGMSEATVSYTAGSGGGTRAYYQWELTPPAGPVQIYRGRAADTSILFKNLVPGAVYSAVGQAFTAYGDGGATSSPISITAARFLIPLPAPVPSVDDLDGDKSTSFARDYTPTATGSGTVPTRDTSTVFDGLSTWALAVGSSAGSATVTAEARKVAGPSQTVTIRFKEGNAGAAQGTLAVFIQPRNKSDAAVGLPQTAYSAAPSTVAGGTLREVQYTLPSTSSITQFSWYVSYVGDGVHARTVNVSAIQILPPAGVLDTLFATDSGNTLNIYDLLGNIILRIFHDGTYGRFASSATADGLRFSTQGGHQIIATDSTGELDIQALTSLILSAGAANVDVNGATAVNVAAPIITQTGHQATAGAAPTPTLGGGAGTTGFPILNFRGTDSTGIIDLVTGTACNHGDTVISVAYAAPYVNSPAVHFTPLSGSVIGLSNKAPWVDLDSSDATQFTVLIGATALADSTRYVWAYRVEETPL